MSLQILRLYIMFHCIRTKRCPLLGDVGRTLQVVGIRLIVNRRHFVTVQILPFFVLDCNLRHLNHSYRYINFLTRNERAGTADTQLKFHNLFIQRQKTAFNIIEELPTEFTLKVVCLLQQGVDIAFDSGDFRRRWPAGMLPGFILERHTVKLRNPAGVILNALPV
nr:MAG TPA: hypothetical protein [Caudoviricetes sp.]